MTTKLPPLPESWLPREHPLYRPRHGLKQRTSRIAAGIFFFVPILLLVVGVRPQAFENRPLAEFPSPLDGWSFFTGLEKWATDHLPLRQQAVLAQDGISRSVFGEAPQLGKKQDTGPVPQQTQEPEVPEGPIDPDSVPKVIEGKDGWLYYGDDVRNSCVPWRPVDTLMQNLDRLRDAVEKSGRKFVFTVAPDKTTMVPEKLPDTFVGKQCSRKASEELYKKVDGKQLDLRQPLKDEAQKLGRPIYAQHDTHWEHEGALIMLRALAEAAQPGITKSWTLTKGPTGETPADLSTMLGRNDKRPFQTYELRPDGQKVRSKFTQDFYTYLEPTRFAQPAESGMVGKRASFFGDSFGFVATPYFAGAFADITLLHTDVAEKNVQVVARTMVESDVVIFEGVERSLRGGTNKLLQTEAVDALIAELAKHKK